MTHKKQTTHIFVRFILTDGSSDTVIFFLNLRWWDSQDFQSHGLYRHEFFLSVSNIRRAVSRCKYKMKKKKIDVE